MKKNTAYFAMAWVCGSRPSGLFLWTTNAVLLVLCMVQLPRAVQSDEQFPGSNGYVEVPCCTHHFRHYKGRNVVLAEVGSRGTRLVMFSSCRPGTRCSVQVNASTGVSFAGSEGFGGNRGFCSLYSRSLSTKI